MSDPESTLPPRQPNTLRTWLPKIGAYIATHPVTWALIGFGLGWIVGKW